MFGGRGGTSGVEQTEEMLSPSCVHTPLACDTDTPTYRHTPTLPSAATSASTSARLSTKKSLYSTGRRGPPDAGAPEPACRTKASATARALARTYYQMGRWMDGWMDG